MSLSSWNNLSYGRLNAKVRKECTAVNKQDHDLQIYEGPVMVNSVSALKLVSVLVLYKTKCTRVPY